MPPVTGDTLKRRVETEYCIKFAVVFFVALCFMQIEIYYKIYFKSLELKDCHDATFFYSCAGS